jgi:methylase of polypeptide subunit release factors
LVAGPSGLEVIEALIDELAKLPERPPTVALEVGAGQASRVAELLPAARYGGIEVRRDLAGIERVVIGRNSAAA